MNYDKPPKGFLKLQQRQNLPSRRRVRSPRTFKYYFILYTPKDISKLKTFIYFLKQKFERRISVKGIKDLKKMKSSYDPFNLQIQENKKLTGISEFYSFQYITCNITVCKKVFKIKLKEKEYFLYVGLYSNSPISGISFAPIDILKDSIQGTEVDNKLISILKKHS